MDSNYDTMAQIPEDLKEDLEPDIQARVENVINSNIARTLGFSFVESGTDYCIARLQRSDGVINSNGRVNGGVISAFIDKVATAAAWANNVNGTGSRGTTISLTVNEGLPTRRIAVVTVAVTSLLLGGSGAYLCPALLAVELLCLRERRGKTNSIVCKAV